MLIYLFKTGRNPSSCTLNCFSSPTSDSILNIPGGLVDGTACDIGKV